MLSDVNASKSCGPRWYRRTTAARSATQRACRRRRRARAARANSSTPRSARRPAARPSPARACARGSDALAHIARRRTCRTRSRPATRSRRRAPGAARPCPRPRHRCRRTRGARQADGSSSDGSGVGGVRSELPIVALQRGAVERAGAGAALVEHDDAVLAPLGAERTRNEPLEDRQPRLSRPARQDEQDAARRVAIVGRADLEAERARRAPCVVERDLERRAREARGARARVRVPERRARRRGEAARRQPGSCDHTGGKPSAHPIAWTSQPAGC